MPVAPVFVQPAPAPVSAPAPVVPRKTVAVPAAAPRNTYSASEAASEPISTGYDASSAASAPISTGYDASSAASEPISTGYDASVAASEPISTGYDASAAASEPISTSYDAAAAASAPISTGYDSSAAASEPLSSFSQQAEPVAQAAPARSSYGVEIDNDVEASEESLSAYGDEQAEYRSLDAQPSAQVDSLALSEGRQLPGEDAGLQMLLMSVPGQPGEDYPIYSLAPETAFTCDDKTNGGKNSPSLPGTQRRPTPIQNHGFRNCVVVSFIFRSLPQLFISGYYADEEARCQAFHICMLGPEGPPMLKLSFLCPNGTIFNQEYFTCDWWFNVDCADSAAAGRIANEALAVAREDADLRLAASASEPEAVAVPAEVLGDVSDDDQAEFQASESRSAEALSAYSYDGN